MKTSLNKHSSFATWIFHSRKPLLTFRQNTERNNNSLIHQSGLWACVFLFIFSLHFGKGWGGAFSQSIDGGYYHSVVLCSDSNVWATGRNNFGQLGDGTNNSAVVPVQVNGLTQVVAVAAGGDHSLALKADGTVWSWGLNANGQLGNSSITESNIPVQVQNLSNIYSISAGENYSLALKNDGTVWGWGKNNSGQLGDGTTIDKLFPIQLPGLSGIIAITASKSHSLALKGDGTLWAWGANTYGQLGNGSNAGSATPTQIVTISDVKSIGSGMYHSLAVKNDGSVWAWGYNGHGVLGNGTTTSSDIPVQIPNSFQSESVLGGQSFSMSLGSNSALKIWGNNQYGQIGNGNTTTQNAPVQANNISEAVLVGSGIYHSLAVKQDGTAWTWGFNNYGQLGDSTTADKTIAVQMKTGCPVAKINPVCGVVAAFTSTQTTICSGNIVSFTNTSTGASNYVWDENGISFSSDANPQRMFSSAGNYDIRLISNPGICADTAQILIVVNQTPDATITSIAPICAADAPLLMSAATSGGTWSGMGISTSGLFDPTLSGSGTHAITYSVTVGNCSNSDSENILVNANPDATITSIAPICAADAAVQMTSATSGGTWNGTGISSSGLFDPALTGSGTHTITYSVTVGNCFNSDSENIIVNPLPQATFSITQNGNVVSFTNNSSYAASYEWNFGDSTTSVLETPQHTYLSDGIFDVVLVAQNTCGSSTFSYQITISGTRIKNNNYLENDLVIYPNPNQGIFTLILPDEMVKSDFNVKIFNVLGEELLFFNKNDKTKTQTLDLCKKGSGIYFLKVIADREIITRRVIVF